MASFERLTTTASRSSRNSNARPASSFFSRASNYMAGGRRAQSSASESQTSSTDPSLGVTASPQQSRGGLRPFRGIFPAPDASVKLSKPAELSKEQQSKYDQMLEHFKSVEDYPVSFSPSAERKPLDDWETLRLLSRESMLRYLRATKWDVAQAKKRLFETIVWRREYGVDGLDPDELEPEAATGKETILGFDNRGRPLHYMHPSRNTTEESPRQMKYAVWVLESAIDLMPPGVEQLALLINFANKKRNPTSISNAKLMLYILQNHYVERLGIALCINVPWIFKAFWNAIYPFIDPVTKSKCKFDEAIKQEVPASQLASDFGGEVDFEYQHDKYWPDLVSLVKQRREQQLKRFKEQCNGEIGASEWVIRGGEETNWYAGAKKDSAFEESPDLVAAAAQAQAASATEDGADGSAVAVGAVPTFHKQVSYQAARADDDADAGEADDGLDRFVTSAEELPENPLQSKAVDADSHNGSESENTTVVNEGRTSTESRKHHTLSSILHLPHKQRHHDDKDDPDHAAPAKEGDQKHTDKSLFAAMVGGVSAAVVGGTAGLKAADASWPEAKDLSDEHKKQNHTEPQPQSNGAALHDRDARNVVHAV